MYVEEALNTWKRKCFGMGYNLDNETIYMLQFSYYQLMIAQNKDDLKYNVL
jgi:hypothetical protein